MILRIEFDRFPEEVRSKFQSEEVYLAQTPQGCIVTASKSGSDVILTSTCRDSWTDASKILTQKGLMVHRGQWAESSHDLEAEFDPIYVTAVAYRSETGSAGLWIDADHRMPSQIDVLRRMYDEFSANGEMKQTNFEEFVEVLNANVVIVGPHDLEKFADRNAEREDCPPATPQEDPELRS